MTTVTKSGKSLADNNIKQHTCTLPRIHNKREKERERESERERERGAQRERQDRKKEKHGHREGRLRERQMGVRSKCK